MARPISKKMLTCSCVYNTKKALDEDRNVTWENPLTLSSVWITTTRGVTQSSNGAQSSDSMLLFFDCVNSQAKDESGETQTPVWNKGAKITFNDVDYYINSITPSLCAGGVHHYEIGLV